MLSILCEKCPNTRVFSGPYFPAFGLNTERYFVFLRIQSGKYGPENTTYLDTFHAVNNLLPQDSDCNTNSYFINVAL